MKWMSVLYARGASETADVEKLWMSGAKAVEKRTPKFISARDPNDPARDALWILPSRVASLDRTGTARKIVAAPTPSGIGYT